MVNKYSIILIFDDIFAPPTSAATGLTTSVLINDWLPDVISDYKFKVNDIVLIESEQLKIYNFDVKNNSIHHRLNFYKIENNKFKEIF